MLKKTVGFSLYINIFIRGVSSINLLIIRSEPLEATHFEAKLI